MWHTPAVTSLSKPQIRHLQIRTALPCFPHFLLESKLLAQQVDVTGQLDLGVAGQVG